MIGGNFYSERRICVTANTRRGFRQHSILRFSLYKVPLLPLCPPSLLLTSHLEILLRLTVFALVDHYLPTSNTTLHLSHPHLTQKMDHPPHSTTTATSASGQLDFDDYSRIVAPFLSSIHIRKTLTLSTRETNTYIRGHRHKSFPGHPVIVGYVLLEDCRTPFWVTGDTDAEDGVKLTIQDKNRDGSAIPISEEKLTKAMSKAQGMMQMDILKNLEMPGSWWRDMIETNKSGFDLFQPWFRENAVLMRDEFYATYFKETIIKYVVHSIANARRLELGRFQIESMMRRSGRLAEVYNNCGWTDLAELNPEKLAKEYEDKLVMEGLPL